LQYSAFPIKNLGNTIYSITKFFEGKFNLNYIIFFYDYFNINFYNIYFIKKFQFFISTSVLNRIDCNSFLLGFLYFFNILKHYTFQCFNVISRFLGRISSFEIGNLQGINSNMLNKKFNKISFNYYCGVDFDIYKININNNNIIFIKVIFI
jgi:hypothetical protein